MFYISHCNLAGESDTHGALPDLAYLGLLHRFYSPRGKKSDCPSKFRMSGNCTNLYHLEITLLIPVIHVLLLF